jgi:translation initiation factor IF-3
MNYGKYKFENEKKVRDSRKKQKMLKLKEIRMQPKIDDHDLDFKSKHVQEFLGEGKCKIAGKRAGQRTRRFDILQSKEIRQWSGLDRMRRSVGGKGFADQRTD